VTQRIIITIESFTTRTPTINMMDAFTQATAGCTSETVNCVTWLNPTVDVSYIDQPIVFQELGERSGVHHTRAPVSHMLPVLMSDDVLACLLVGRAYCSCMRDPRAVF
jgi:hypothetical protein